MIYKIEVTKEKIIITLPGGQFTEIKNDEMLVGRFLGYLQQLGRMIISSAAFIRDKEA